MLDSQSRLAALGECVGADAAGLVVVAVDGPRLLVVLEVAGTSRWATELTSTIRAEPVARIAVCRPVAGAKWPR
ncbi:hypothetical protein ACFWXA_36770 [Streptomyces atroolivaceus]|uniref:hypothetical protein n=1 Tax=Streptomyces atroolivaceus TaxID=66869 RepID=UPI003663D773